MCFSTCSVNIGIKIWDNLLPWSFFSGFVCFVFYNKRIITSPFKFTNATKAFTFTLCNSVVQMLLFYNTQFASMSHFWFFYWGKKMISLFCFICCKMLKCVIIIKIPALMTIIFKFWKCALKPNLIRWTIKERKFIIEFYFSPLWIERRNWIKRK